MERTDCEGTVLEVGNMVYTPDGKQAEIVGFHPHMLVDGARIGVAARIRVLYTMDTLFMLTVDLLKVS